MALAKGEFGIVERQPAPTLKQFSKEFLVYVSATFAADVQLAMKWKRVHSKLETVEMLPGEHRRDRVLTPGEEAIYFDAARSSKMHKHNDPALVADVDTILIDCA